MCWSSRVYDADGNQTQKEAAGVYTYYTWDETGRMAEAHPAAGLVSLVYDARGKRVSKQAMDRTVIVFIYDFDRLLKETDASGDTETSFTSTDQGWGT